MASFLRTVRGLGPDELRAPDRGGAPEAAGLLSPAEAPRGRGRRRGGFAVEDRGSLPSGERHRGRRGPAPRRLRAREVGVPRAVGAGAGAGAGADRGDPRGPPPPPPGAGRPRPEVRRPRRPGRPCASATAACSSTRAWTPTSTPRWRAATGSRSRTRSATGGCTGGTSRRAWPRAGLFAQPPKGPEIVCRAGRARERIEWQADAFAGCLLVPRAEAVARWRGRFGDEPLGPGRPPERAGSRPGRRSGTTPRSRRRSGRSRRSSRSRRRRCASAWRGSAWSSATRAGRRRCSTPRDGAAPG